MSVRNLDKLFQPRSVALIGATPGAGSARAVVMRNLCRAGFPAERMLVNPQHSPISTRNSTACRSAFQRASSGKVKNIEGLDLMRGNCVL